MNSEKHVQCCLVVALREKCQHCFISTLTEGVLCDSISLEVLVLFDMNSDKRCVALFSINSLKVSGIFYMNSKIIKLSNYCFLNLAHL